jgi:hypothetical protein
VNNKCRSVCDGTEVLNRKSVYRTIFLGIKNTEGPKDTIDLDIAWSREQKLNC